MLIESKVDIFALYSLVPKESNVTLVPHITLIRPNTLSLKGAITLFWVNTKRKTVMTLFRIVLLSNGCAVITLFKIYLKRVMTDPFTFECHYSLLDHVKLKLQSWLSFGTMFFTRVESWLSLGPLLSQSVLPLPSFRTCLSFGTREYQFWCCKTCKMKEPNTNSYCLLIGKGYISGQKVKLCRLNWTLLRYKGENVVYDGSG